MKVGVIVAMKAEFELVERVLTDKVERKAGDFLFVEGKVEDKNVVLLQCGIGKVCSAVGTLEMIRIFNPKCIINTGIAGGIDPRLQVMDIVVGDKMVYHDVWCGEGNQYGQVQGMPSYYLSDRRLFERAMHLTTEAGMHSGLICSGDRFITDRKELDGIKDHFPQGLAVDMESCSIAQVCYMYSVPFLSLRIISDTPGIKGHAEQYRDFWTAAPRQSFQLVHQLIKNISDEENTKF